MILIYCSETSPRIEYTFDVIFNHILKSEYKITFNLDEYITYTGAKFSYGKNKPAEGLFFGIHNIMFEDIIIKQYLEPIEWNGIKGFFQVQDLGFLPFDLFASAFYMLSRYEEYIAINYDKYKRYKPEDSVLYTYNLLDKPIVNIYANEFKKIIHSFFPFYQFPTVHSKFEVTFDIDNAFCYKQKGFLRSTVSVIEDLVRFRFKNISDRFATLLNIMPDPYDTYKKQVEINDRYKLKPLYFFLLGDFGGHDKNVSYNNRTYRNLIKRMDEKYEVALHPSYGTTRSDKQLLVEKLRLENILGKKVTKSRQFFNKITLPETYEKLVEIGITDDYSMGYNQVIGFRAGTSSSFPFFDLKNNKELPIMLHPYCMTDKMFKLHLRIRSTEVVYHARQVWDNVKYTGGDFRMIMHNETLGTKKMWRNWQTIYEEIIRMVKE